MKTIVIMRGLPGSGKSTKGKSAKESVESCGGTAKLLSTDDYFMNDKGEYCFDSMWLRDAHNWNRMRAKQAVRAGFDYVIIDNTNTQFSEVSDYVLLAFENGYGVQFVESDTDWKFDVNECFNRNTHSVPKQAIQRMMDRWDTTADLIEYCIEKFHCKSNNGYLYK